MVMRSQGMFTVWHFVILVCIVSQKAFSLSADDDCKFQDLSPSVASVVCAVERGAWFISSNSSAVKNAGCLLGAERCNRKRHVPTQKEISPSPPPPASKSKAYQDLALAAEKIVPKTWWRDGFADPQLLLTSNDRELPRKQFDASRLRNKKLKNLLQCVTRQTFIRKSFAFDLEPEIDAVVATKCTAMSDPVVISFLAQWNIGDNNQLFGGEFKKEKGSDRMVWAPKDSGDGKLLVSALQVQNIRSQKM
jgi:hypothetical protein